MRNLIKVEELFMFVLSLFLFSRLDYAWWLYALLFFAPDLSMIGYIWNPHVGSWTYNLVHHKAVAIGLYILGAAIASQGLQFAGLILFGHSSLDRVLGYGLKYPDAFQATHLGMIGKSNQ